jgi:hypothetical protein
MRNEKGSALIMVILVVVVLTMVGLAAAFYMSMEDRISQNDKLLQAALQAAQAGLKEGEQIVSRTITNATINTALDPTTHGSYSHNDLPTAQGDLTTATHLGVVLFDQNTSGSGTAQYNVTVGGTGTGSVTARYTLYLRNDPSDYLPASDSGKYYIDHNGRMNLISRGSVTDATGREIAVKILTEQIYFGLSNVKPGQFRFGQLGTSATQY